MEKRSKKGSKKEGRRQMGKDVRNGIRETDKGMGEWREEGEQWTWDTIGLRKRW